MQPLISIIVPVYQVEAYVKECLDSIRRQSYKNLEVIFVDDCGADDSINIIRQYLETESFPKSRIIGHEHNRGLSAARNTGIDNASGEYIYFLDSDDTIPSDALETLTKPLLEKYYDFVIGDYNVVGSEDSYPEISLSEGHVCGNDIMASYSEGKWYMMAWNKLCNREFILKNDLYFEEGLLHEDVVWSFKLAALAKSMYVCRHATYNYRVRTQSIMTATAIDSDVKNYLKAFEYISEFISNHKMQCNKEAYRLFEGRRSCMLFSLLQCGKKDLYRECYKTLMASCYISPLSAFRKKVISSAYLLRDIHYSLPLNLGIIYKEIFYLLFYKLRNRQIEGALFR